MAENTPEGAKQETSDAEQSKKEKAAALTRANQLMDEAAAKRTRAQNLSQLYMGSDLSKASHNKLANMAEEDAEVLTERAKQYRKAAEGKKKGGVVSASKRADGIAQRGKTRGKIVMCGGGMYKK